MDGMELKRQMLNTFNKGVDYNELGDDCVSLHLIPSKCIYL